MLARTQRASRWHTTLLVGAAVALASTPLRSYAQEEAPQAPAAIEEPAPVEPAPAPMEEEAPAPMMEPEPAPAPAPMVEPAPVVAPVKKGEGVEEIVVTGTRIGRSNLEEYGHITVVSGEQLAASGVTTIDELLLDLPSVTLQGINKNQNNGGEGLAFIDLRNLGSNRTLVLVNGRRFVTTGTGVGEAVDLNNIPVQLIDRVEVLLDGASAIYGSDAIGGVVNIILKNDFEGMQLDAHGGISSYGDGEEMSLAATMGTNFDRGNLVFNLAFLERGHVAQKDRDWAKDPIESYSKDADGNFVAPLVGSGIPPSMLVFPDTDGAYTFVRDPATGASFQPWSNDFRYNFGDDQWLMGKQRRFAVTTLAHFDMSADTKAYFEGTFTHRHSRQRLAAQPAYGGTATFSDIIMPMDNPYIPADFRAEVDPLTTGLYVYRRMNDVGRRIYDNYSDTFRLVTGVKGKVLDQYNWDVYFNYGLNRQNHEIKNSINMARMIESVDPQLCAINAQRGCVVANLFGDGALQPEARDYIGYTDTQVSGYQHVSSGGTVTGDIVELPAGGLGFALGVEHRDDQGFTRPDAITQKGDSAGNGLDPTQGGYYVTEAFGELSIPLLKGVLGAEDVTLDLAGRFSDYSTFGSEPTFRVGLSYAPVADVRLRGVYSTAFRAPGISDLYGGSADSYEELDDPCNHWDTKYEPTDPQYAACQGAGVPAGFDQNAVGGTQIRTNIGGSPDLKEETADVLTAGLVFTPTFAQGLSLTVDYYNVTVKDAIANPNPQTILNGCYETADRSDPYCDLISRGVNGAVNGLQATSRNIGKLETSGIDLAANYVFDLALLGLPGVGRVNLGWQGNYLFNYDETLNPGTPYKEKIKYAGQLERGSGTYAHWRWFQTTGFSRDEWAVTSTIQYVGGADYFAVDPKLPSAWKKIDPVAYWNLGGHYGYEDWTVIVGVNNVLNQDPPFMFATGQNAEPASYDFMGRFFFTNVSYKF